MFLRKNPNKSGSTSVQVIVKTKNCKQRVVKTIGSSRDTDEIERLMAEGRKYISDQNGPLFPDIDEDENAVDAFVGSLTNSQIGHNHTSCAGTYKEHACYQQHSCSLQAGSGEDTWNGWGTT